MAGLWILSVVAKPIAGFDIHWNKCMPEYNKKCMHFFLKEMWLN